MAWLKRALGVKIFFVVWLPVLLIPLWRLHAWREWRNPQLLEQSARTGTSPNRQLELGLSPQNQSQLARRFPGEAAAELTALSQPNLGRSDLNSLSNAELQKATGEYFARLARLSARFPHDLSVRAQWLRDATQGPLSIESAQLQASYNPTFPTTISPPWISAAQREAAIACARAGAAQEPGNAFWPWMEAIFQFSLRRDELALRALERAGSCASFDDRTLETVKRRIALMHRVQIAGSEDEFWEALSITFPHYGRLRSAARQTIWLSKGALERGEGARALEIADILQRAGAPVAHSNESLIGRLVGEALSFIAWSSTLKNAGMELPNFETDDSDAQQKSRAAISARFAAYARQKSRPDIARRAQVIAASMSGARLVAALRSGKFEELAAAQNRLGRWHWALSHLLRLTLGGALVWGIFWMISRKWDAAPASARRGAAVAAAFGWGATGATLAAGWRLGAANEFPVWFDAAATDPDLLFDRALPFAVALIWLAPTLVAAIVETMKKKKQNTNRPRQKSRFWRDFWRFDWRPDWRRALLAQWALYALAGAAFFLVFDTISNPPGTTVGSQLWPAPLCFLAIFWLAATVLSVHRTPRALWGARWLLEGALLCWAIWAFLDSQSREGFADIGVVQIDDFSIRLIGISAPVLAGLSFVLAMRAGGAGRHPFWRELATRTRLAAATLAVAGTLAYALLSLVAMPMRHRSQKTLQAYLEMGEPRFIEREITRAKQLKP